MGTFVKGIIPEPFSIGDRPQKPYPVEYTATDIDRDVKKYRDTGDLDALRRVCGAGVKPYIAFSGWSAMGGDDGDRWKTDGPKLPEWLVLE